MGEIIALSMEGINPTIRNKLMEVTTMEKVTRTIKYYVATITDTNNTVLDTPKSSKRPSELKVLKEFFKTRQYQPVNVDVKEIEEKREMPLDFFLANSTIVKPDGENKETSES